MTFDPPDSSDPPQLLQPNSRNCFVCGLQNAIGLRLRFFHRQDGGVQARVRLSSEYEGYPGLVHGGIVAALLDEIVGRALMVDDPNRFMMTARLELRYRQPVPVGQPLQLSGWVLRDRGRSATAHGELRLLSGELAAEAEALLAEWPDSPRDPELLDRLGWKVVPE